MSKIIVLDFEGPNIYHAQFKPEEIQDEDYLGHLNLKYDLKLTDANCLYMTTEDLDFNVINLK